MTTNATHTPPGQFLVETSPNFFTARNQGKTTPESVESVLQAAAKNTGVSPEFLAAIAKRDAKLKPGDLEHFAARHTLSELDEAERHKMHSAYIEAKASMASQVYTDHFTKSTKPKLSRRHRVAAWFKNVFGRKQHATR